MEKELKIIGDRSRGNLNLIIGFGFSGFILEGWGRVRTGLNGGFGAGFNSGRDRKGLNPIFGYLG